MKKETCLKCGHTWVKRVEHKPRACPNCKNPKWYEPKKNEAAGRDKKKA